MDRLLLSAELGLWTQMYFAVFSDRSAERLVLVASDLISEAPFTACSSGQFRQAIIGCLQLLWPSRCALPYSDGMSFRARSPSSCPVQYTSAQGHRSLYFKADDMNSGSHVIRLLVSSHLVGYQSLSPRSARRRILQWPSGSLFGSCGSRKIEERMAQFCIWPGSHRPMGT